MEESSSLPNLFEDAASVRSSTSRSSSVRRAMMGPEEKIAELEQEMRLLKWHKVANAAALKAALIRTKKLRSTSKEELRKQMLREKALWMRQVIEEEQQKPLHMNEDFVRKFVEHEKEKEERLEKEVWRNISTLSRLKEALSQRELTQRRQSVYRRKRRDLLQRSRILTGGDDWNGSKRLQDRGGSKISHASLHTQISEEKSVVSESAKVVERKGDEEKAKVQSNIMTSLDKLVQLENRISTLEDEGTLMIRQRLAAGRPTANRTSSKAGWRKRRVGGATPAEPSKTMYSTSMQRLSKRERGVRINSWLKKRDARKKSQRRALRRRNERLRQRSERRQRPAESRGGLKKGQTQSRRTFKDIKREYDKKRENVRKTLRSARAKESKTLEADREAGPATDALLPSIRGKRGSRLNRSTRLKTRAQGGVRRRAW